MSKSELNFVCFDHKTFIDRIETLRKKANVKQNKLCEIIGVSPRAYQKWKVVGVDEQTKPMSMEKALRVCDFFGVSLDYLFGRTDYIGVNHAMSAKLLGLSPKAIDNIAKWHQQESEDEYHYPIIETLSRLIESPCFESLISSAYMTNCDFNRSLPKGDLPKECNTESVRMQSRQLTLDSIKESPFSYPEYVADRAHALETLQGIIDNMNVSQDGYIKRRKRSK